MGLFGNQVANIIEWEEYRDDIIFWKWKNKEIKKGSKLIIRAGQDAIFMYNGVIEGIFTNEGEYNIESDIVPFLSTLKGFRFGFNNPMRAELLFINTRELTVKWGTKNPISLPVNGLPGGMPIRAFGNFTIKIADTPLLIEKVAGVKTQYTVEDVRERVTAVLDSILMKWMVKEGKDMFNLQANSYDIGKGVQSDLDMEMAKIGLTVTGFQIQSVSYPDEVARIQQKAAAMSMVGDLDTYTKLQMAESLTSSNSSAGTAASSMAGMAAGMTMAQQMAQQTAQAAQTAQQAYQTTSQGNAQYISSGAKFCPGCGKPVSGERFCRNCGYKLKD